MSEATVNRDEAVTKIRATIEDRAKLMATMLKHMQAAGVADAETTAASAAYELGQMDGKNLQDVKTAGELAHRLFTPITQDVFDAQIVEDAEDRAVVHIHHCPLVVGWRTAGLDANQVNDICNLANTRDSGLASELPLNMGFSTRIAAGDGHCTFVITKK
ncbi:MAG: L-2-amino-thiazoline-4-carboxylic acid hydrolase [Ardenticatenaceae bacterium]|nr:L-2-amino-thiazoline-4-carboxylic acid hydrolase [Ardenticatenaceae bacterium]